MCGWGGYLPHPWCLLELDRYPLGAAKSVLELFALSPTTMNTRIYIYMYFHFHTSKNILNFKKTLIITDEFNIYIIPFIFKIEYLYGVSFIHWRKVSRHKTTKSISFLFPRIENHIQIVYLINPPWYDHFKLILRILESNYKLMSYTVDCRFTCTSKGVNSFCTRVPLTNYSGCAE